MAITTSTIALPAEVSDVIIQKAQAESAVLQLAGNTIAIKNRGEAIPVIAGDPTAYIVEEGGVKTNSDSTLKTITMIPKTFAIIEAFSNQFRDDEDALYSEMVNRLPRLLGQKFDETVFGGTTSANFHTFGACSAVSLGQSGSTPWAQLVSARSAVETADGELTAWAMSNQGVTTLMGEVDGQNRPLFVNGIAEGEIGRLAGVPVVKAKKAYKAGTPNVLGVAGDWTNTVVGIAKDVELAISDQASLTTSDGTINLWEKNMFAVRCEFCLGFVTGFVTDANVPEQFVRITA